MYIYIYIYIYMYNCVRSRASACRSTPSEYAQSAAKATPSTAPPSTPCGPLVPMFAA